MPLLVHGYKVTSFYNHTGRVVAIGDGVAKISGLYSVGSSEMIHFGNNLKGMVINLEVDTVSVIIFAYDTNIFRGLWVYSTRNIMCMSIGCDLLGRVINPLGVPIDGEGELFWCMNNSIEASSPGFIDREPVSISLITGWKVIDSLIPIGRGQRELIIGDQKTGNTTIALDSILSQKYGDSMVFCVYVAVGQRNNETVNISNLLNNSGCMEFTIIICSPADDPIAMQYISPYAGCVTAEYFMCQGAHSLIIYDDLTNHAAAYSQISLILSRPPGSEAFPGDVFYLHSRLLERAAMLSSSCGGGSLTALPVVETINGDLSAYIPTNLISITDGQIYLDNTLLEAGVQPPVHSTLSVSSVGAAAQGNIYNSMVVSLNLVLAQYGEVAGFENFGASIDESTQMVIVRGNLILELLKQDKHNPWFLWQQLVVLYTGVSGFLDGVDVNWVHLFELECMVVVRFLHILGGIGVGLSSAFISSIFFSIKCLGLFSENFAIRFDVRKGVYLVMFEFFKIYSYSQGSFLQAFLSKGGRLINITSVYII